MLPSIARALRIAARDVDRKPSDGQKEAGNYKKGHLKAFGFDITLENPKGSTRSGKDANGKEWKCTLPAHYGYLKQTVGADKDHLDVYIGDDHDSSKVFVVDQVDAKTDAFDEHKALLGFKSKDDALSCYEGAFSDGKGKDRIGAVHEMPLDAFRAWAKHGDTKSPLELARKYANGGAVQGYAGGGEIDPQIQAIIDDAAARYGIDPSIMRAFAGIESGYNPSARTGSYQGLYQLSNGEFSRYGGTGNIYDPVSNAHAAALKLKSEMADFSQRYGRDPTAGELYMMHQQGVGGSAAHWANPDAPAWENMYSTAEGRQKGPGWAKQAIWGNVPSDVRAQYPGGVDSLTGRQFTDLWNQKVARFGAPSQTADLPQVADNGLPNNSSIALAQRYAPLGSDTSEPPMGLGAASKGPSANPVMHDWDFPDYQSNHTPKSYSSNSGGADWVESPLGLMPKWDDGSTPLQGFADGGTIYDLLNEYYGKG